MLKVKRQKECVKRRRRSRGLRWVRWGWLAVLFSPPSGRFASVKSLNSFRPNINKQGKQLSNIIILFLSVLISGEAKVQAYQHTEPVSVSVQYTSSLRMDSDYGIPRELSDLQKLRSLYQPELPPCLQVLPSLHSSFFSSFFFTSICSFS